MNFVKKNNTKRREDNHQRRRSQQPARGRGQQLVSTLDPRLFEKKAKPLNEVRYESPRKIQDLPVDERIKNNLITKGYLQPTEIQDKTLEAILTDNDLMGIAQTGTGKTGAFLIPVVH
ncbi:MAG TPA: DEAD/DEAH box helicase, partial [Cyclobacteriaceae bacterium]|nr:DEAD/DEAH box helicase [Cyclobacteriaceae bacterium]